MLLDVEYVLLGLPGLLVPAWAWWSTSAIRIRAARMTPRSSLSGGEVARLVMRTGGCGEVPIDVAAGPLADHYVSGERRLRLSEGVYHGRSPAAIGIASHEAGHALQAASGSPWRLVRRFVVPLADPSSILAWMLLLAGISLGLFRLTLWGLAAFSLGLVVQLFNLGAEYDATRRANEALRGGDAVEPGAEAELARVQSAAAWIHVAAVAGGFPAMIGRLLASSTRVLQGKP